MYKRQRYNIILKQCEILCKEINKRLWLILSNRNGTKLNHKAEINKAKKMRYSIAWKTVR